MTSRLDSSITHWVSTDACLVVRGVQGCKDGLVGDEPEYIYDAIPSRIKEFTAGRSAARAAMEALGIPFSAVLQGAGGEPVWPDAICGSISHTDAFAVAFVARKGVYESVGVDIDDDRPITDQIARDITWSTEVSRLLALGICEDRKAAQNFAFSAKEAIYKCQYPRTLCHALGFRQVRLVERIGVRGSYLGASGWRVPTDVAAFLPWITVIPVRLAEHRIVCATYQRRIV